MCSSDLLAALLLTAGCAPAAAHRIGHAPAVGLVLAFLLGTGFLLARRFLASPSGPRSRWLNHFSGIWTLVLYLSLGIVPLLWKTRGGAP